MFRAGGYHLLPSGASPETPLELPHVWGATCRSSNSHCPLFNANLASVQVSAGRLGRKASPDPSADHTV
jgi:hypothetical protein